MNQIKNIFKNQKKYLFIGLIIVLAILYFMFGKGQNSVESYTVSKVDLEQSVILSGEVETSDRADLGFAASGRLANVYVKNNQKVTKGQILAQLEVEDLLADLKIKKANSRTSDVNLVSAKQELEKTISEENTKVENAYRAMLSGGLVLNPDSNGYNVPVPTIEGIYGGLEGRYKIILDKNNTSSDLSMSTFNLEKTKVVVNENSPTPLGTEGLYISFGTNDLTLYDDNIWYLDIPNKASPEYLANYNAYLEAQKRRDSAVNSAESEYEKLVSEQEGGTSSAVALAEIQKINAEIRKNTIYAPFSGRVTNIEKEVGESASVGERVISILGEDLLEVVLQVSELDVSRIVPGATIDITLDAFTDEIFKGILKTINSKDTEIDGVPVYEAFVELKTDSRIKTGMSATGKIVIAEKSSVLAIPSYLVKKDGEINTVQVLGVDGKTTQQTVTLGMVGTDSMVEILSGLNEGDKVVAVSK